MSILVSAASIRKPCLHRASKNNPLKWKYYAYPEGLGEICDSATVVEYKIKHHIALWSEQ